MRIARTSLARAGGGGRWAVGLAGASLSAGLGREHRSEARPSPAQAGTALLVHSVALALSLFLRHRPCPGFSLFLEVSMLSLPPGHCPLHGNGAPSSPHFYGLHGAFSYLPALLQPRSGTPAQCPLGPPNSHEAASFVEGKRHLASAPLEPRTPVASVLPESWEMLNKYLVTDRMDLI